MELEDTMKAIAQQPNAERHSCYDDIVVEENDSDDDSESSIYSVSLVDVISLSTIHEEALDDSLPMSTIEDFESVEHPSSCAHHEDKRGMIFVEMSNDISLCTNCNNSSTTLSTSSLSSSYSSWGSSSLSRTPLCNDARDSPSMAGPLVKCELAMPLNPISKAEKRTHKKKGRKNSGKKQPKKATAIVPSSSEAPVKEQPHMRHRNKKKSGKKAKETACSKKYTERLSVRCPTKLEARAIQRQCLLQQIGAGMERLEGLLAKLDAQCTESH